ncbi:leucyl aminopeptidase [Rhodopirellula halodulae]|uniref:leucyl aminopeptidase n=1 Tax=Rhodopirellula halodulae TaxID=2894198 RepID=UPI001E33EECA|nr:leucyl aminopeptidase [Rhodopirellula sp. JC737]MCC9655937.1 leucyl aminopeptidase [Rhodopirellula sp. JC737]
MQPLPFPTPNLSAAAELDASNAGVVVLAVQPSGESSDDVTTVTCEIPSSLSDAIQSVIKNACDSGELTGKPGEITLFATGDSQTPWVLLAGVGTADQQSRGKAYELGASVVRRLIDKPRNQISFVVGQAIESDNHDAVVAGAVSACEGQHLYHSAPAVSVPENIAFVGFSENAVTRGGTLGRSINHTRRLVNEPPSIMNPSGFAQYAEKLASECGLSCEVWDEKRLEAENCRAILAVGRASTSPPRLVMLRHDGGGDEAPLVIVGKGVTFDSGGLSLKPSEGMVDMKCDMAGAATVVGVMHALAELKVPRNVIGLCGLAENMVSGDSYKLGDVIETRSGKTIEILNTDAEGRVVLADTLDVAVQHNPEAIVDLATLTGACMVALGTDVAGLMTNSESVCDAVEKAANAECEPVWELPMFALYDEKVKSKVADIKNVGEGRWGGAITAAKFLENFVAEVPWVHIDIAGPAFMDSPKPHRDAGATGVMVRSLVRWVENAS